MMMAHALPVHEGSQKSEVVMSPKTCAKFFISEFSDESCTQSARVRPDLVPETGKNFRPQALLAVQAENFGFRFPEKHKVGSHL